MTFTKQFSLAAVAALTVTTAASAAVVSDGDFQFDTSSDTEGWTPALNITGLNADGDSLNGVASSNDPQLNVTGLALLPNSGATFDTLVFRVRETRGAPETEPGATVGDFVDVFDATGIVVALNGGAGGLTFSNTAVEIAASDDFFTVSVDISSAGTTTISSIRVDPIGGAASNSNSETNGNSFEIDFIQVNDTAPIPEPASAVMGLTGLGLLMGRRRKN